LPRRAIRDHGGDPGGGLRLELASGEASPAARVRMPERRRSTPDHFGDFGARLRKRRRFNYFAAPKLIGLDRDFGETVEALGRNRLKRVESVEARAPRSSASTDPASRVTDPGGFRLPRDSGDRLEIDRSRLPRSAHKRRSASTGTGKGSTDCGALRGFYGLVSN
jgi:hypothetical protein